jgi:vacuolar-type H+-ATPase subunit H
MDAQSEQTLRVMMMVTGWCEQAIRELEKAEPQPESLIAQLRRTREEAIDAATARDVEAHART